MITHKRPLKVTTEWWCIPENSDWKDKPKWNTLTLLGTMP